MHIYGSVGPFHLMEVPTIRLPNVKMLLRWPSRMHIYCFVEITLYLCTMHLLLIWSLLMELKSRHRAKSRCFALRARRGWGFELHRRPKDLGPQRKWAKAAVCFSKQRAPSEICAWREERNFEAASEAMLRENERWRAKEVLSMVYIIVICIGN